MTGGVDYERLVDESCAAQGVPARLTDPTAVAKLAAILRASSATMPAPRKAGIESLSSSTTNAALARERRGQA